MLFIFTGNEHMFKTLRSTYFSGHTGPTIYDSDLFFSGIIESDTPVDIMTYPNSQNMTIDAEILQKIESYDPVGLLVLKNEKILFEKYWNKHEVSILSNSFSAAKSIVGLAVFKAIELGLIKSTDEKVIDFIPELKGKYRESITIKHLLNMTSGINFDESYGNPFGFMAKAYYGDDLLNKTLSYESETEPGSEWKYLGGNTILLSIIVSRVSNMKLSEFVSKHIWKKIGASKEAIWSLDSEGGMEKAYCCYYATLRDFARLGLLVVNDGLIFNESQFDSTLIQELKSNVVLNNKIVIPHYSNHWWKINYKGLDITYARGILGQYIITIPDYNMVVVRIGKKRGPKDESEHPVDLYDYLDLAISLNDQIKLNEYSSDLSPDSDSLITSDSIQSR